ncbi:7SK snRNA methylphosphate capping enzyme [Carassius gibelio]|uniref:7SK snRNA methylphosphate capping enzyme n=1 Tax=Carassius gibelio TaxID=101364 RepID=UPI0022777FF6|nr:7SK snRNA methylphosphate capping enzyme [Carassius gibelio]
MDVVQSELLVAGGVSLHAHPQPITVQEEVTANMVLTELPANHETPQDGTLHVDQIKNGLQVRGETAQRLSKRRYTTSAGFKHPSISKRRRRANSECDPVLPSNFLLGGNIFDPLNLNSLLDEEVSKALNAQTPKSSPLPKKSRDPVEILIPKDITDPLNLSGRGGDGAAGVLVSPLKTRRRHRNRHHPGATAEPSDGERSKVNDEGSVMFPAISSVPDKVTDAAAVLQSVEASPRPYELNTSINCRDEVVTPNLPRRRSHPSSSSSAPQTQPSKHRKRRRTNSRSDRLSITPTPPIKQSVAHSQTFHTPVLGGVCGAPPLRVERTPQQRRRIQRSFQYGSYNRYYGYRTPSLTTDPRLALFRPEWFRGKKVLDVGCNTGHMTLAIARHWSPERVLGVDIDGALVHVARQNLRYFLSELQGLDESGGLPGEGSEVKAGGQMGLASLMDLQLDHGQTLRRFPISFTRCRGPIATFPIMPHVPGQFPCNVYFLKGDYVPDSDEAVMSQCAEYDVILCLSLTKWVHLNYGDAGIQRLFQRIYRHLLPGGVLILEPQPWSSYSRSKRLTEVTYRNYRSIRLKPDQFSSFLTAEVGFSSYELIGTPHSSANGLQKMIYLFHKGPASNRK